MALRGRTEPHRPPGGAKGIRCPHRIPQRQNSAPSGPPRCPPPHSPTPRGALNAPLRPLLPKPPPTPTPPQSPPNPPGFQLLPRGLHHRRLLSGLLLRRRPPLHGITFGFIWAFLTHGRGVLLWTGGGGSNAGVGLSVPAQSGAQTAPPLHHYLLFPFGGPLTKHQSTLTGCPISSCPFSPSMAACASLYVSYSTSVYPYGGTRSSETPDAFFWGGGVPL